MPVKTLPGMSCIPGLKEAALGWKKLSTPLPSQAWPGRVVIAKPGSIVRSE